MKNFSKKTERLLIETKMQLNFMHSLNILAQNWRVKFLTHRDHSKFFLKVDKGILSFYFPLMNQMSDVCVLFFLSLHFWIVTYWMSRVTWDVKFCFSWNRSIFALFFSTTTNFGPLSKGQPGSSDLNHCVLLWLLNSNITRNVLMNLDP